MPAGLERVSNHLHAQRTPQIAYIFLKHTQRMVLYFHLQGRIANCSCKKALLKESKRRPAKKKKKASFSWCENSKYIRINLFEPLVPQNYILD